MKTLLLTVVTGFAAWSCAIGAPLTVELKDGSKINGDVVSWDGTTLTLKASFGQTVLNKNQLTPQSLEQITQAATPASMEAAVKKIADLEATVESLRADNAALRAQLESGAAKTSPAVAAAPSGQAASAAAPAAAGTKYWISTSGTRHNSNCRYFGTTKGKEGAATDGNKACKVCGG